ncbi:MAG: TolC family protein [Acidaminobacter sp.]|uniref:TolC family protein n=1 Tax=Acidaminobacter sp. TaxID=1872102 RepID=UPI00137E59CF|nr:TolC family protein [Acidaminobacter sp.]MZQ99652.1 TolC family protein [Acidaminobacter sp.]
MNDREGEGLKRLIALLLCMALTSFSGFAAENETRESLKKKAVESSIEYQAIENGIITLQETLETVNDAKDNIEDLYEAYQNYVKLYEAGAHLIPDPEDPTNPETPPDPNKIAYLQLQGLFKSIYGIETPSLTEEQIYDNFIVPVRVLPMKLSTQIDTLRIDRSRLVDGLESGIDTLWFNLGYLGVQGKVLDEYLALVRGQLDIAKIQLEIGRLSELEYESKKMDLQSVEIDLKRLTRENENLEYRLRSLAGLNFDETFSIFVEPLQTELEEVLDYESLRRLSLRTRVDSIRAMSEMDTIQLEEKFMEDYITDEKHPRRLAAAINSLEAEREYKSVVSKIDQELYSAYNNALTKREAVANSKEAFEISKADYQRAIAFYSVGYLSDIELQGAKLAVTRAELDIEQQAYQFSLAYQNLIRTVTFGAGMGGQ